MMIIIVAALCSCRDFNLICVCVRGTFALAESLHPSDFHQCASYEETQTVHSSVKENLKDSQL